MKKFFITSGPGSSRLKPSRSSSNIPPPKLRMILEPNPYLAINLSTVGLLGVNVIPGSLRLIPFRSNLNIPAPSLRMILVPSPYLAINLSTVGLLGVDVIPGSLRLKPFKSNSNFAATTLGVTLLLKSSSLQSSCATPKNNKHRQ